MILAILILIIVVIRISIVLIVIIILFISIRRPSFGVCGQRTATSVASKGPDFGRQHFRNRARPCKAVPSRSTGKTENASKPRTLSTKVFQKCLPFGRKSTSKTLSFWGTKMRQKRAPLARKCVENANPYAENRRRSPSAPGVPKCVKNVHP